MTKKQQAAKKKPGSTLMGSRHRKLIATVKGDKEVLGRGGVRKDSL